MIIDTAEKAEEYLAYLADYSDPINVRMCSGLRVIVACDFCLTREFREEWNEALAAWIPWARENGIIEGDE